MDMTKNQLNMYPLGRDKELIVKTLSSNSDLVYLLLPNYDPLTATQDLDIILKEHIYKTISIDNTEGESRAYICIETYIPYVENDCIKEIGIVVNIFCHKSLINLTTLENNKMVKLGYYGNRIDQLLDCIDRCLNGKRGIGLGRLRLKPRNPVTIYQPSNGYYGKSIEYTISDFNSIDEVR
jgi:hypothetical protein